MKEEFDKLANSGKIKHGDVDTLVTMATEGFCRHRSWGVGRITTVDTVLGKLTIDFAEKPGHAIDLGFAVKILEPISKDNIEARKLTDMSGLKGMAAMDHLGLIKLIIDSYGDAATTDKVQEVLVPDVIEEDYKKWWETARREMKKDGHFTIPTKKGHPITYQVEETPFQQRVLEDFVGAKGLKQRVIVVTEISKGAADLDDAVSVGTEVITLLNNEIKSHARTQTSLALEAVFARDDVRTATGAPAVEGEPTEAGIWENKIALDELLGGMPVAKQRRVLQSYQAHKESWVPDLLGILNQVPARLCGEIVQVMAAANKMDELKMILARLINQHTAGSELLLWLAKNRTDTFADILGPEAFRAMIAAIEHEGEKKTNKLRDFIVDDPELVDQLTQSADIDVVKDITRAVQLSPSFEGMDKRSVLGKLVKSHPTVQSFITGSDPGSREKDSSLVVSWVSLERRKEEYEELVQKRIPANSKEIAVAREYGDLRENHEYKAAKEMQKVLMSRKGELEMDLERARGTDFSNVNTGQVSIGTRVTVTNLGNGSREEFILLGAWDSDPDRNVLSYLTPMGQALLNHKPGEEVAMEGDDRRFRIESIAAHNPGSAAATPEPAAVASSEAAEPSV